MNGVSFPDSTDERIIRGALAEQVRLLYGQALLSTLASALIALLLVIMLWDVVPHLALLAWLIPLETILLIRLALILAFYRCQPRLDDPALERWASRYVGISAISGICWGSSIFLLALVPALFEQILIILLLGAVLMVEALTMTPLLSACIAHALLLALPPTLWLLLQESLISVAMGIAGILYLLLALGTAYRHHQTLTRSLRLAMENLELAKSFAAAKEQAEIINQQLADRQAALQDSVNTLREFYRVIAMPRRHPSDQIRALLTMGCERFGTAIGIVASVENQRYEVIEVIDPTGQIFEGDVFFLGDTYCSETVQAGSPLHFEHAGASRWRKHPCYLKLQLESYLGTPIEIGGQHYGTLCFCDPQPRPTAFSAVECELIQLMARWVGVVIEQQRMASAVQRQQTLLVHASRLNILGVIASGLAHEINQPITAIALYAETSLARLRNSATTPAEIIETLQKIVAQSARTHTIIQHIRRFARQSNPQYLAVRIPDLLQEIDDFLLLETRRHEVLLQQTIPANLPLVLADPLQFQQVILNLVHNAVEAMQAERGPRLITLSAHVDREMVEISLEDTGPGVSQDVLNHLLHPFFTTKPEGLGLGLSISESIAEAHGGRLWATPNRERGLTFHFTLPIANPLHLPASCRTELSLETTSVAAE